MPVIVFDVNETLLDLSAVDSRFADLAGARGPDLRDLWFARLLHLSGVVTLLGSWQDFGVLAADALRRTMSGAGLEADAEQLSAIVATMRKLPAHPDVVDGIMSLRAAGWGTIALTNSSQSMAEEQLDHAALSPHLDAIISVDATLRFKPAVEVYRAVEAQIGTSSEDLVLVAAHDWDCAGAMRAGWRTGFVERSPTGYSRVLQPPTWRGADIRALAAEITAP